MSWDTVSLGEVITHRKGFVTIDDDTDYKLCRVQLHRRGVLLREIIKGRQIKTKKQQLCKAGDFIVAEMDAKVGGYGLIPDELEGAIVSSHYYLFEINTEKINPKYIEVISQLQILQNQIKATGSTNYAAIRPYDVLNWEIPLPDIKTQDEIAAIYFRAHSNCEFLNIEHSQQLDLLKKLRQQILQDAVQGKLIPQDPNDEPATRLLEHIKAEKEELVREKKIKKEKLLPPIKPEEIPFEIPENWVWCRLGEVATQITDGEHQTPPRILEGRKLLSAKNIRDGFIDFTNIDFISESHFQKSISRCHPQKGDILIVSVGATIGRSSILEINEEFAIVRSVALIKPLAAISNKYIKTILDSPLLQKDINVRAWGTAQPCLYLNQINELSIPLPPLTEQNRIVAKIEQLIKLCDELEQTIQQNQTYTQELLQVTLKEALEPKMN